MMTDATASKKDNGKEKTKREKFVEIAERRTVNAQNAIANLRGLASPSNYEYTMDDWSAIFGAIESELQKLQEVVKNPKMKVDTGFKLTA